MKVSQTASNRHFRSALRAGVGCGDVTALSCFIFDPMCHPRFSRKSLSGMGHRTRQIRLICVWDFGLTYLDDPHRFEKILPFQTLRKNGPTGAGMEARGCFLTPAAKASHKPAQAGQRGDLALPAVDLPGFFFFKSIPKSSFLCLCGAVFAQDSLSPLL